MPQTCPIRYVEELRKADTPAQLFRRPPYCLIQLAPQELNTSRYTEIAGCPPSASCPKQQSESRKPKPLSMPASKLKLPCRVPCPQFTTRHEGCVAQSGAHTQKLEQRKGDHLVFPITCKVALSCQALSKVYRSAATFSPSADHLQRHSRAMLLNLGWVIWRACKA